MGGWMEVEVLPLLLLLSGRWVGGREGGWGRRKDVPKPYLVLSLKPAMVLVMGLKACLVALQLGHLG